MSTAVMVLIVESVTLGYVLITTGLPAITGEFATAQGGWLLTAYILFGAVSAPIFGRLADIHGKRRIMLVVLGIGFLGALVAATAPTFGVLIVGRALQGTVIATLFLCYSLMRDVYPPRTLALAASISTTGIGLISVVMPFLIGWLLDNYGWRTLFYFDMGWIAVLAPLLVLTTRESSVRVRARIDVVGGMLLGAGVALVLAAVSLWRTESTAMVVSFVLIGVVLLTLFVVVSLRRREPLVDLRIFARRAVLFAAVTSAAAYAGSAIWASFSPTVSMTPNIPGVNDYGLGITATHYAVIAAASALLLVLGGLTVGTLGARFGARRFMLTGLLIMAVGGVLGIQFHASVPQMMAAAMVIGYGTGLTYGSLPNLVVQATPVDHQGSIASMVQVFQSSFASAAPVVFFAILAASAVPFTPPGATAPVAVFYSDAALSQGMWVMVGILVGGALLAGLFLRSGKQQSGSGEQSSAGTAQAATTTTTSATG